jgi:hypothetical protein
VLNSGKNEDSDVSHMSALIGRHKRVSSRNRDICSQMPTGANQSQPREGSHLAECPLLTQLSFLSTKAPKKKGKKGKATGTTVVDGLAPEDMSKEQVSRACAPNPRLRWEML